MGRHISNALLGLIGGFVGVIVAGGFYQTTWLGRPLDIQIIRKSFLWLSDYFIVVPLLGGLFGGASSDKWWGAFGGGFFLTLAGFYLYVFMLGGAF
ncbi:MAG: hypothetical protein PVF83_12395 [Anaerolineales bacterium]|jgi:hypothetical protein